LCKTHTKVTLNAWSSDKPVVAAGAGTTCVAVRAGSLRLRFGGGAAHTVGGASAPGASSCAGGEPSSCPTSPGRRRVPKSATAAAVAGFFRLDLAF
jgi:hypothetical protein